MKDCKHGQVRENKRYLTLGSTKRGKPCLWDPVKESGMLLVTGPTGSGKTCLLAMLATQTLTNGGRVFYTSLAKDSDSPDAVLRHCDSVTGIGDFAGVVDHLERLCDELEQRAALVVEHHTDSIYKIDESMVSAGEQHLIAPVTVIIDDFDYLFQWWHTHPEEYARKLDVYRLMGSLAALVGRGRLLGIRLAMAAQHFTIDDMVSVPPIGHALRFGVEVQTLLSPRWHADYFSRYAKQSGILQLACFDGEQLADTLAGLPQKPRADTSGKRDLRFTGDSDDMHVLVPLSNNTFACRPDECPVVLTNHSTEDDIILECARLLDMLEPMRDHSDQLLPSAYWNTCSALHQLVAAFTDCDPKTTIAQSYGGLPRVTCLHGEFDSWEAYAQHAIHYTPEPDNGKGVES